MYLLAFELALISYVYSVILTEPGMILSGWYRFLASKSLPEWIFKPLIDCYKCVSGQFAFWGYIVFILINDMPYNIFKHVVIISLTIFITLVINKIYEFITTDQS
jgi:hypothetical protein